MAENKNRWKIQALSTLLTNAHLTGFFTGKIFKGNLKGFCVPGLNCYSCPGAIGSCPIGSLQAVIQILLFLLCCWNHHSFWCAVRTGDLRISVPLWLVSRASAQDPYQKIQYQKTVFPDLREIHDSAAVCNCTPHDNGQRSRNGRSVVLQMVLPRRCIGRRHSSVYRQWCNSRFSRFPVHLEKLYPHWHRHIICLFLSPILQMVLPAWCVLCSVQSSIVVSLSH